MPEKTVQKEPGKKPAPSKKPKPQQEVVVQISLSELHPFPDHPFQVREDAAILKILFAPLSLILSLFVWLCAGLLSCSGFVFKLASGLLSLLAFAVMITYSVKNGIILLVLAFLISPMGLPLLAVQGLGKLQDVNAAMKNFIHS